MAKRWTDTDESKVGRKVKMTLEEFKKIADEVVKIYFDYNYSVKEAIEKAKEVLEKEVIGE